MTPLFTATVVAGALLVHSFVMAFSERGPFFFIARLVKRGAPR